MLVLDGTSHSRDSPPTSVLDGRHLPRRHHGVAALVAAAAGHVQRDRVPHPVGERTGARDRGFAQAGDSPKPLTLTLTPNPNRQDKAPNPNL